jgi:hypothetical protein
MTSGTSRADGNVRHDGQRLLDAMSTGKRPPWLGSHQADREGESQSTSDPPLGAREPALQPRCFFTQRGSDLLTEPPVSEGR